MTKAKLNAHWALPDETLGDGYTMTHKREREASEDNVEYTRTDAFIEKAWNWVEDNLLSSNQQDKSLLYYEQFKKYLEE